MYLAREIFVKDNKKTPSLLSRTKFVCFLSTFENAHFKSPVHLSLSFYAPARIHVSKM